MKITRVETFQADAGWRMFSFLKVTTDDGIIGWSEFNESFGSAGLSDVIRGLSPVLIGRDPRMFEQVTQHLHVLTRQSRGGLNQQAIAAIENALLDVTGKAYGVPVYALFGGPIRERIPVYWSHFGTYRVRSAALMGVPAAATATTTSRAMPRGEGTRLPCAEDQHPADRGRQAHVLRARLRPHRRLAGTELGQPPDPRRAPNNCWRSARRSALTWASISTSTSTSRPRASSASPTRWRRANLTWLEIDTHDAPALAEIKRGAHCPIASCETLHGRREFKPFFDHYATDVAIVDVIWNGLNESLKIASMADVYEINVAPHNFYGHLCSAISATFSALVPNFRVMEIDIDSAPWRDEFYMTVPTIENGEFVLPTRPRLGHRRERKGGARRPPKT